MRRPGWPPSGPPTSIPRRPPYYYSLEDWSILGRMPQLRHLTIRSICIEDFSFLCQCQALEHLSLYNTNFSDCRLLLELPRLKSADLRLCPLEHREALDHVSFTCILKDEDKMTGEDDEEDN